MSTLPRKKSSPLQTLSAAMNGVPPEILEQIEGLIAPMVGQMPEPNPNFIFGAPGTDSWGGKHPRLAGAIEGGLLAAATTPPSQTIGEGFSNVAQSLLRVPQMRQQHQMSQLMAPFGVASQIQDFRSKNAQRRMNEAHAELYGAQAKQIGLKAPGKFTNVQRGTDGKLYGINEISGQLEAVPTAEGVDPSLFGRQEPAGGWQEEVIKAKIGSRPQKQSGETDEQFQMRLQAWGSKALELTQQMATDPKVAAAIAASNARPVIVMTPQGPVWEDAGTAKKKNLPSQSGFVDGQIESTAQMVATGQIDLDAIKNPAMRSQVWNNLKQNNVLPVPMEARKVLTELDRIESIVSEIKDAYAKVKPKADASQFARGNVRKFMAKMQADPDVQLLQSKIGFVGNVARGLSGEKGVLTDPDIQRAWSLLPTEVTRADVGEGLFNSIDHILSRSRSSIIRRYNQTYSNTGQANPLVNPMGSANTAEEEYERDPVTKKLVRKK